MGTLPAHTGLLSAETAASVLSLSLLDIKCCFKAVLMVVCEFVVVRDEVWQSQEVAQQPKLYSTLQ